MDGPHGGAVAELVGRHDRQPGREGSSLRRRHKKNADPAEALGRSRGGFTTKLYSHCDVRGLPLAFVLTPGQVHDQQGFGSLFQAIGGRLDKLLADRGYDADQIRSDITYAGACPVIPAKRERRKLRQPRSSCLQAEKAYRAYVQQAQKLAACRPPIRQDRPVLPLDQLYPRALI
ncbi:transposase [Gluconobacter sp. OJB]|uniref:transposase n=1 Tax=Gluconobacter sp. OJB TaxID=3145196 RepID=UPI0038D19703